MTISAFFLNRRFSDQSLLQAFLRGLGGGSLFLVLSVFFLGLGGGTSAFAQSKKNYLGGGLVFIPLSTDVTGSSDGETVSDSADGSATGINLSYIHALNQSFWIASSLSLGSGEIEYEETEDEEGAKRDIGYASLDVHALYKTPSPFFIGGGLSIVSYEEDLDDDFEEDTFEIDGFAPSLRGGALFADLGPGALMLDAVWRGEVSSDDTLTFMVNGTEMSSEVESSMTSYQISVSYLFNF